MADIHPLPTNLNGEAVTRLTEKLSAAFKAGENLGPRAPHIHALAETLERTLINLNHEVEGLNEIFTPVEVKDFLQHSGLQSMCDKLKQIITSARKFPV